MKAGQRVMVIASWLETQMVPPPIGSVGVITVELDEFNEYEISVPGWPCPVFHDPDWIVPAWAIIPIDDEPETQELCCGHSEGGEHGS